MSNGRMGKLLSMCVGDITSMTVNGHVVRREMSTVDGERFYRFTKNPGLFGEYQTFWSADESSVLGLVTRRCLK